MNFREDIRFEYPLTASSLVIDAGGYEGKFALEISLRYDCQVIVYEPVFYERCRAAVRDHTKIFVQPFGIAARTRKDVFHVKGDMTGLFAEGEPVEVQLFDVCEALPMGRIDLLKLNVEGAEFEILERLLEETSVLARIKDIQVQFHPVVEDASVRWQSIRSRLLETRSLTFDFPWCWENYSRRTTLTVAGEARNS